MKAIVFALCCLLAQQCFCQQQTITLYFDFNKADITAFSAATLDNIATSVSSINAIELSGHCDSIGSYAYNDRLSMKRTAAVKQYLLEKGFSKTVFKAINAAGKRQPAAANNSDANRAMNRRVELSFSMAKTITTLEKAIVDTATKEGDHIALKDLQFEGGRHFLTTASEAVLLDLLLILLKYPGLSISLEGHICCTWELPDGLDWDTQTQNLSVNRAKYIYDYLVEQGINKDRLSYKGFGNTQPLVYPEKSAKDEAVNRRVEIKIVKKTL